MYLQIDYRCTGRNEIYIMSATKGQMERFYEENVFSNTGDEVFAIKKSDMSHPIVIRDLSKELTDSEILNYALHKKHTWVRVI